MNIDAHHHFWRYSAEEYGWLNDSMSRIRRDFLPEQLREEITAAGIQGVISVQARQTLAETRWLLSLAAENPFIKAVVGWLPLAAPDAPEQLATFAAHPKARGVRHVLQGEPDEKHLTNPAFNAGIRALRPLNLVYDLLIFEDQLPPTIAFVDQHPNQTFVLDHLAKPRIRAAAAFEPWNRNLRELAKRENVFCKLSGMVTEADWNTWTPATLRPYAETVLSAFGPSRTMFGSDWPVCLVASSYARWVETVRSFTAELSPEERAHVWGETAVIAYRLTA